jgi:hypothetical protein
MQNKIPSQLSDPELVAAVATLASSERRTTVALVAHLAELDARRLYLGAGFPSMFVYCVQVLHLSEGGAYNRIEAARAARSFPVVLDLLDQGLLNLATLRLLAPHLTIENHEELLAAASEKSKREVEALLARAFPRPDVAPSIRKLPGPRPSDSARPARDSISATPPIADVEEALHPGEAPAGPEGPMPKTVPVPQTVPSSMPAHPLVTALSPERYQIRFTASGSLCEKLRRAQDLLRHAVPNGDPAEIFDRALTALLAELERKKFAATDRPRASRGSADGSRHIPATVKRAVVARDGGRCAFVARSGQRCGTRAFLELHHLVPYALGGPATVDNIQLRCRAHNGYEAELDFGTSKRLREQIGATRPGTSSPGGDEGRSATAGEIR